MIFDKNGMMGRRVQHHNAFGTNEQKLDHWDKGTKKKMTNSATNELGKHPCEEEFNGVAGKTTTKSTSVLWAYGKTSQDYEVTTGH